MMAESLRRRRGGFLPTSVHNYQLRANVFTQEKEAFVPLDRETPEELALSDLQGALASEWAPRGELKVVLRFFQHTHLALRDPENVIKLLIFSVK